MLHSLENFTCERLLTATSEEPVLPAQAINIIELLEIWGQFGNFMLKLRNTITNPEKTAEQR